MFDGDVDDRPRERLLRDGARRLSDAELVALVLRNGRSGQSAVALAESLLALHGDLSDLAVTTPEALAEIGGMGPAKAAAVVAAFELGQRCAGYAEAVRLRRAEDVVAVARRESYGLRRDELLVLVTDAARRVRWTACVGFRPDVRVTSPVRAIGEAVSAHGGRGFAVARLVAAPTAEVVAFDVELARRLDALAGLREWQLHDYVVVADQEWTSVVSASPPIELLARMRLPAPHESRAGPGGLGSGRRQA